jgi:hypothetical protein
MSASGAIRASVADGMSRGNSSSLDLMVLADQHLKLVMAAVDAHIKLHAQLLVQEEHRHVVKTHHDITQLLVRGTPDHDVASVASAAAENRCSIAEESTAACAKVAMDLSQAAAHLNDGLMVMADEDKWEPDAFRASQHTF